MDEIHNLLRHSGPSHTMLVAATLWYSACQSIIKAGADKDTVIGVSDKMYNELVRDGLVSDDKKKTWELA